MQKYNYLFIITALIIFSSCVSKKKFVSMEQQKEKYKTQTTLLLDENGKLKRNITQAESEFETLKNELHAGNAVKDDLIDELTQKVNSLESTTANLKSKLNNTMSMFQQEQTSSLDQNSTIASLELEIEQLKRDTLSLNYSMKLIQERTKKLKEEIDTKTERINDRNIEISSLKSDLVKSNGEINSLKGKISAQKEKMADIGKSFIELRKELLRANTAGKPIDPNSNSTISKISKSLDQY